jgi:hypothetical protein
MLYPLQTWFGGHPSPVAQLSIALSLPLVLASGPLWLVLFLPTCDEGELGQAHLPTLFLAMSGVQWTLHG